MAERKEQACIGFHATEGQCGRPVTTPDRGRYWCPECNAVRMEHLDKQFEALAKRYGIKEDNNA